MLDLIGTRVVRGSLVQVGQRKGLVMVLVDLKLPATKVIRRLDSSKSGHISCMVLNATSSNIIYSRCKLKFINLFRNSFVNIMRLLLKGINQQAITAKVRHDWSN